MRHFLCLLILCFSFTLFAEEPKGVPPLRVVYFSPRDKTPESDRHERIGRTFRQIQEFYRKGMEANGYGPKTFALEWDEPGKLKLYDVKGKKKTTEYLKNAGWDILNEVKSVLKEQGIDADREFVLILCEFRFEIADLEKVPYEMRLVALFPGGYKRTLKISYSNVNGEPTLEAFAGAVARKRINVAGVDKLELVTEDGGDGWANDWGLWIEPELSR